MRSIERRFKKIVAGNPYWSDFICYSQAVKGGHFSKGMIARHFNRLVDREDYSPKDKKAILGQLVELSNRDNRCEDDKKSPSHTPIRS